MSFKMSTGVTAIVVCCILTQILCVVSQKSFSPWTLLGDQTPYRGSAPGPRWGPQIPSLLLCPPIILWGRRPWLLDKKKTSREEVFFHFLVRYNDLLQGVIGVAIYVKLSMRHFNNSRSMNSHCRAMLLLTRHLYVRTINHTVFSAHISAVNISRCRYNTKTL